MNEAVETTFVLIPVSEWRAFKSSQDEILAWVKQQQITAPKETIGSNYITAIEFMEAVRIRRSKFDELVAGGKIATVKKKRKIYVQITEIERYFTDPTIE